jgi:hypothetical protein
MINSFRIYILFKRGMKTDRMDCDDTGNVRSYGIESVETEGF